MTEPVDQLALDLGGRPPAPKPPRPAAPAMTPAIAAILERVELALQAGRS